ncbi:MAG TPA: GNAT family N-acetyltransferase, partial [Bacteroidia bacterium]|nr:GNAT family N-acetyltransferase [Bacteroidia bacterium]
MIEFNFSPFPVLQTERLTLRRITRDDAEIIFKMRSDPEITRYSDRFPPRSIDEIHDMITRIEEGVITNERISWALSPKGGQEFMGTISFHDTNRQHHRAEVGYQLLSRYWRKGFMSEAMNAVIDYGFNRMNLHSIEANINPNNIPSKNLLLKYGFVQEAFFRENYFFDGKF